MIALLNIIDADHTVGTLTVEAALCATREQPKFFKFWQYFHRMKYIKFHYIKKYYINIIKYIYYIKNIKI